MRPRVIRIETAGTQSAPSARAQESRVRGRQAPDLRSVNDRHAAAAATELWIGIHLTQQPQLQRLAIRAQRFTPRISLVPPDGLVLEVKGSLHLFDGMTGLFRALEDECHAIGLNPVLALAPTPSAAIVAARVGKPSGEPAGKPFGEPFVVTSKAQLVGRLASLPLTPLRWPQDVLDRLARMGIRTIGQVLRLPRAGFARRFGVVLLAELDRLTGRSADLRHRFEVRERFRRRRELTYELESSERILAALAPLLADLGNFLQARQCGLMRLECFLRHRHAPVSKCELRLAAPLADVGRLTELLGERLNAVALPEPVRSCELRSGPLISRTLVSASLWQPGEHGGGTGAEASGLIELLRARLGVAAVYGLQMLSGHRPENAWSATEPKGFVTPEGATKPGARRADSTPLQPPWPAFRRPIWLLPAPRPLEESDGMPLRCGPLRLFGDVERVETGWWDGGDIGRDYYTAFDIYGVQLWIFRERAKPHRWYLHGVFG